MDTVAAVAMGAWCDYMTEDEHRDTPFAEKRPLGMTEPTPSPSMDTLHFRVEEFATLSDGRRVTLTNDRGWSSSTSGLLPDGDPWAHLTTTAVRAAVMTTLLPDDAARSGDPLSYSRLAVRLAALGVTASANDLRELPYTVMLSERLQDRLSSTDEGF